MFDLDIDLCPPATIYLIFSITQILIDLFKGLYNTASVKVVVMVMITLLLNILCKQGLTLVSWIIVFIPFILMTVIVSIILYVFGLNATTGTIHSNVKNVSTDASGNIFVYDPNYNAIKNPFYYSWPYVVVPNPDATADYHYNPTNSTTEHVNHSQPIPPLYSSSPAYQSE